jgi:hypothetical protein
MLFLAAANPAVRAQWVQTSGPEGGHIQAFGAQDGFVFAGTFGSGNFRSSDGGTTWTQVNTGYGYPSPTSYLVKGDRLFSATVNVFHSTDHGDTWTGATGLPTGNSVTCLATDGTNIYGGISAGFATLGVFRSTDDGDTWQGFAAGLPDFGGISSLALSGSTVFAAASGSVPGVYRSFDQGMTWSLSGTGQSGIFPGPLLSSTGVLLVGTASGQGVYRSTNNGDTWQQANAGLPANANINALLETAAGIFAAVGVYSPLSTGVYLSTDGGNSWADVTSDLPLNQGIFSLGAEGATVYAGVYGKGVHKSTNNGGNWTPVNSRLIASRVGGFAETPTSVFAVISNDGVYRSADAGDTWERRANGIPPEYMNFAATAADGGTLVALAIDDLYQVRAFRTVDDGANWIPGSSTMPTFFAPQKMIVKDGNLFAAAASAGVYMSTDYGDTWTAANNGIPFTTIDAILEHNGDLFAAGNEVYRSTDDGASWTLANTGIPSFAGLNGLASSGGALYAVAAYSANVYRTTDMGGTWTTASVLPGASATDLIAVGNVLFAGVINAGVYRSTDAGSSWANVRDGLPTNVTYYRLHVSGADFYCGTDAAGVWKRPLSEVTSVKAVDPGIPSAFVLAQNYPNPFNPATVIRFQVAEYGRVVLNVHDILGRQVAQLVDEPLGAGTYEALFDAAGLASGTYYYRLTTGPFTETKKMMLVR